MATSVTPQALSELLASEAPHALLDVREQGEYNAAHIPGARWLPRRLIELDARKLVPFAGTRPVVCDDDGRRAGLAAATLERMGYGDTAVLEGGLNRWTTDGLATEWGLNVPSKAFGESVLAQGSLTEVSPDELHAWLAGGEEVLLLDARTPEEHAAATIPGSRSLPGGELALRFRDLPSAPSTRVVVHCAGRTRSIIGARTLQRMGVGGVHALRNGTMGWTMAGYALEKGPTRTGLPSSTPHTTAEAATRAQAMAEEDGVRFLSVGGLRALMATSDTQNVYLIDPRTREEYAGGHIPGFRWFPGGQAVQRADEVMAVRQGHVVFSCDGTVRAGVTGSWFRQMGFPHVYAVHGGTPGWSAAGHDIERGMPDEPPFGFEEAMAAVAFVSPTQLLQQLGADAGPAVIFVGTSREFTEGHVPGARWHPRGWLEYEVPDALRSKASAATLTCADGVQSTLAGATMRGLGYERVTVLRGGMGAWREAGLATESGLVGVATPPQDVVATGTERTPAEMMHYLRWEEELGR